MKIIMKYEDWKMAKYEYEEMTERNNRRKPYVKMKNEQWKNNNNGRYE